MLKIMIPENWAVKPHPPFLPFRNGPGSCHTGRIPMVPILQIHTQIPPIQISSYRLPTFSTFQNTHIYRTTGLRIMVHMEGL